MQAKKKPVEQLAVGDLGLVRVTTSTPTQTVEAVNPAPEKAAGEVIEDDGTAAGADRRLPRRSEGDLSGQDLGVRGRRDRRQGQLRRARAADEGAGAGGAEVAAVVLGPGATEAAAKLGEHGAATVYASDDAVYDDYVAQPAAHALWELVEEHQPNLILFGINYDSRDVAGRLQALTGSTLMGNATRPALGRQGPDADLRRHEDRRRGARRARSQARPVPAEVVRGRARAAGPPSVVAVNVEIRDDLKKAKRIERHEEAATGPEARGRGGRHLRRARAAGRRQLQAARRARGRDRQLRRRRDPRRRRLRAGSPTATRSARPARP